MSGGSYDYIYSDMDEQLVGFMYDAELDDMMGDLTRVCHDLEWWESGDICEESYRKTVRKFKDKWFKGDRAARLEGYVDKRIAKVRAELMEMIGAIAASEHEGETDEQRDDN